MYSLSNNYLKNLSVPNGRDYLSDMDFDALQAEMGMDTYVILHEMFLVHRMDSLTHRKYVMRWVLRGLPPIYAVQKVLIGIAVEKNRRDMASKTPAKPSKPLPKPPTIRLMYQEYLNKKNAQIQEHKSAIARLERDIRDAGNLLSK